jgi:microsomal dipeptidase-like Zn-dependent dipeptidase
MLEGNVALATLAAAVKTSRHMNIDENPDRGDDVRLIAMARRWPRETWSSLLARTLHFATRARAFAAASGGTFRIVETREDLAAFLAARTTNPGLAAAILSIEGAHALDDDAANVEVVADAGFRMISPAHFFDTAFGGSAHGVRKHGLTDAGREMIRRMEARGVILDVAHASETAIDDALAIATRPVVASHTGLRGVIDNRRNLPDAQLEGIAATGGVVGIGFWDTVTGGTDAASIARSIAYAVERVGADHVALGSDWDGAVAVPFDAAGTGRLTEALLDVGLDEPAIRAVMGESALRVFAEVLPTGELPAAG